MIDFASAYEAPVSLDSERLFGTQPRRASLWKLAGGFVAVAMVLSLAGTTFPPTAAKLPEWLPTLVHILAPIGALWIVFTHAMAVDWGGRKAEYWVRAAWRFVRLPRRMGERELVRHHANMKVVEHTIVSPDFPRCVLEVSTLNLRMTEAATLKAHIGKLHAFLVGLKFPVQIVVRAWAMPDQVKRRWFVAVHADSDEVLASRVADLISGLRRAGLESRQLNGDLFDSLQSCWTVSGGSKLGPASIERTRHHAVVDGEIVRGFLLTGFPRTIDPNWLAPILDGDLAIDYSCWLEPLPNSEERDRLYGRIVEWETSQYLTVSKGGFRDPDLDELIKDATKTRLHLQRRWIRVFNGSIGFVVRGKTPAEVDNRERLLLDQLREAIGDTTIVPLDLEHDLAVQLAVPNGYPPIRYPLRIVSPALAMSHPFSNSSLNHPGGVDVGRSIVSQRINMLDLYQVGNPHMVIPGTSGSGKGYWLKVFVARLLKMVGHANTRIYIIQTEKDEYTELARHLNASRQSSSDPDATVARVDDVGNLAPLVYPEGYQAAGAFREPYDLMVIDLTHMPPDQHGQAIAWLLKTIRRSLAWGGRSWHAYCVIDELGIVLANKDAADAIAGAYRTFRSIPRDHSSEPSRCAMIGLTQRPSDLLGHATGIGKVLADLAETHLYLRQKPTEMNVTARQLKLSDDEVGFLEHAGDGEALLVAGRTRVALRMHATDDEHKLART